MFTPESTNLTLTPTPQKTLRISANPKTNRGRGWVGAGGHPPVDTLLVISR